MSANVGEVPGAEAVTLPPQAVEFGGEGYWNPATFQAYIGKVSVKPRYVATEPLYSD